MFKFWNYNSLKNPSSIPKHADAIHEEEIDSATHSIGSNSRKQVSPLIYDSKNHQDVSKSCIICLENCANGILCDGTQSNPRNVSMSRSDNSSNSSAPSSDTIGWGWTFSPSGSHGIKSTKNVKKQSDQAHFICQDCFASYVKSLIENIGWSSHIIYSILMPCFSFDGYMLHQYNIR